MQDEESKRRAAQRAQLADRLTTTVAQRLGMMRELATSAWLLTGAPMPRYERADMPGRVIRAVLRQAEAKR